MRPSMLHAWMLLFQVAASVGYTCCSGRSIRWWRRGHDLRAGPHRHGGGGHRRHAGADVALMATYSLVCNLVIALVAPVVLSFAGSGVCTPTQILARIAPLLIMPFASAQACRFLVPRFAGWIGAHSQLSFWMWLVSLVVVIGRTTSFILDLRGRFPYRDRPGRRGARALPGAVQGGPHAGPPLRRSGGRRAVAGQKNTVLAVWMAQSFLNPVSSIAPTAYIVWQNFVNSYQIYRKDRERV